MINQQKKKAINIFFSINSKTYPKKKKKSKKQKTYFLLIKKREENNTFFSIKKSTQQYNLSNLSGESKRKPLTTCY